MPFDEKGDVGFIDDLIFVLKNMVALEDHAVMSSVVAKTEKEKKKWAEVVEFARAKRTKWMQTIVKKEASAIWCVSKHISAIAMGLEEVGNRYNSTKQTSLALEAYHDSAEYSSLLSVLNDFDKEPKKDIKSVSSA